MNKTLLLIIVDFLFLNLIALTRWEKAEPSRPRQLPVPEMAGKPGNLPPRDQDLVEVMRLSLADEQKSREQTSAQLQAAQAEIQTKEQNLSRLQTARVQLESSLAGTQQSVRELNERVAAAAQERDMTRERLAQIQRQLEDKQSEADREKQLLAALAQQQSDAQQRIEGLNVAVKVAEQEKALLRSSLDEARHQVENERLERQKVMAQTGQLAEGVGQLAKNSGEIAQEIRSNQPINANTLFNDFLSNRVSATFSTYRKVLIGSGSHVKDTQTVLVTDGKAVYALLHANETPFPVSTTGEPPDDWERITGQFGRPPVMAPIGVFQFLALDPRLIVIPVDEELAARMGVKVYKTAAEPFKFPDAVLVSRGGAGYGEVPFKVDPQTPQYVRMDNRIIKHLIGEFTPTAGDLVFSKTGDLIGIMVNSDYCAVVDSFLHTRTITTGEDTLGQHTGSILAERNSRLLRLPSRLQ
jgi:multidrug efflux pump subunit AcrA (membrane-fusion protein)